ncbi:arylsulfatase [Gimibacter soli]|uniref:Arylsulfatase n=1 Tax=Gimibacter soli TaxID=3024400 RepID=A0AAE9XUJ7_9PROT|nr:arylsulfatase [Gimibacter soli]WCL53853.1 arylsulfatase [Gimibacter soli]
MTRGWLARLMVPLLFAVGVAADDEVPARPNFLVVLIDDAAYMDLGTYGGEAHTPTIDEIAERGTMFTNYHTSPLCAPSRAMLLTGLDNHRTGLATIPEVLPPEHVGKPGYAMRLEPGVTTIATRLKGAGYRTLMTGKWHLGHEKGDLPVDHGFDRSFILDASGADNWEQKSYMPYYKTADWFEGDKRTTLPDDFYSSEFLVDKMIDYLDEAGADKDKPFFAYLAFQAIHIPVQAPKEYTDHYENVYEAGWENLREARFNRARELGLAPEGAPLKPMPDRLRKWADLSDEDRAIYARSMAVNAGMIEAMDHHLGRLIDHLRATGQLENTVIIVTSDNGPEPSNPVAQTGFTTWMYFNDYDRRLDNLGEEGSYAFIGPEWATAAAAPHSLFKFYASEGGMRVPFVMAGPGVVPGARTGALGFVTDIAPTLLDYAGAGEQAGDMTGRSLRPVVNDGGHAYGPDDAVGMEVSGNAALYKGNWKLVRNMPPWGDGTWQLFDMATDPGETTDLSESHPDVVAAMHADYATYAEVNGVQELPAGYNIHKQIAKNAMLKQLKYYGWVFALVLAGALGLLGLLVWGIIRLIRRH